MKTTIYLIRHGQSIGNRLHLMLGHTDLDLTELGLAQANATAEALSNIHFDAIYSSDLIRAMYTARPNANLRGIDVIPDKRFRELYLGEWEGKHVEDIARDYGEKFSVEWRDRFGIFRAPNGESVPELAERIYTALVSVASEHPGETLAVATHAAAIRAVWGKISDIQSSDLAHRLPFPSNASYSILEYDGERLVPVAFSQDDHLADIITTWKD